jgi:hypothetical protein
MFDGLPEKGYICIKTKRTYMENFQIRSYGKSELALCYSPDITESAARRKLMRWIDRKPGLMGAMRAVGYNELSHTFLPLEVKLIVEALGEP